MAKKENLPGKREDSTYAKIDRKWYIFFCGGWGGDLLFPQRFWNVLFDYQLNTRHAMCNLYMLTRAYFFCGRNSQIVNPSYCILFYFHVDCVNQISYGFTLPFYGCIKKKLFIKLNVKRTFSYIIFLMTYIKYQRFPHVCLDCHSLLLRWITRIMKY